MSHQDSQAGLVIDEEGQSYAEEGKRRGLSAHSEPMRVGSGQFPEG